MEYLTSNLLIAWPFVDNAAIQRSEFGPDLTIPAGIYSLGNDIIPKQAFMHYGDATYETEAAKTRIGSLVPLDLFADMSVSVNFQVIYAELATFTFQRLTNSFTFGVRVLSNLGTYYWMSEPILTSDLQERFIRVSTPITTMFTGLDGSWWQKHGEDITGNIDSGSEFISVKAVLSVPALTRILNYAQSNIDTIEILPLGLKLESRVLHTSGGGNFSIMLRNTTPPTVNTITTDVNDWGEASSMSQARSGHTLTTLNDGRVLAVGGANSNSYLTPTNSAEIYNPATNSWKSVASMSKARCKHAAVKLNDGRVFVVGGEPFRWQSKSYAEIYDPVRNKWTDVPGSVPVQADNFVIAASDNRVFVFGGGTRDVYAYNVESSTWTQYPGAPAALQGSDGVMLDNGKVLVYFDTGAYEFNTVTQVWSLVASSISTASPVLASVNNGAVALGVNHAGPASGNFGLYSNGAWTNIPLSEPRINSAITSIDGKALISGGLSGGQYLSPSTSVDVYNNGAVTNVGNLAMARWDHASAKLDDNRVIVCGGIVGSTVSGGATATTEIFSFAKSTTVTASGESITGPISGLTILESGYNTRLDETNSTIKISTGSGLGKGALPCKASQNNAPAGVEVGGSGDLKLKTDDCHTLVPYIPLQTFYVFGNCESCCSCDDYGNFFKALKKYGVKWGQTWDGLDLIHNKYMLAKTKYDALRRQSEAVTAKISGSVSTGEHFEEADGYPQWLLDKAGVARDYSKPSTLTANISVAVHNPTPKWYDQFGSAVTGKNRSISDIKLMVEGWSGIDLDLNTATLTWGDPSSNAGAMTSGHLKLLPSTSADGQYFNFNVAAMGDHTPKIKLDPCIVLNFEIKANVKFNTMNIDRRKINAHVSWKLSIDGDYNLDGLPDSPSSDLGPYKVNHATMASILLEL